MPPEHAHSETHAQSGKKVFIVKNPGPEDQAFIAGIKKVQCVMIKTNPASDCYPFFLAGIVSVLAALLLSLLYVRDDSAFAQSEPVTAIIAPGRHLKPFDAPETYGPDTLWEKINGQAEFYLSAGFQSLKSQLYAMLDDADSLIEVNVYHMGDLSNAFSVFSLQRRDNAQAIDVTPLAYQSENAVYLVHGPYYLEIISMASLGPRLSILTTLAERFVGNTPIKHEGIQELLLFPPTYQVKGSAALISSNAFGYDRLDNVFTTTYLINNEKISAYISKQKTPSNAKELAEGLHAYFKGFGGNNVIPNSAIEGARMIEIMDTYELMFSIGKYLAGVHEAPTREQAETLAKALAESLQEKLRD
jgi:uncharacterized protein DUF6599